MIFFFVGFLSWKLESLIKFNFHLSHQVLPTIKEMIQMMKMTLLALLVVALNLRG